MLLTQRSVSWIYSINTKGSVLFTMNYGAFFSRISEKKEIQIKYHKSWTTFFWSPRDNHVLPMKFALHHSLASILMDEREIGNFYIFYCKQRVPIMMII